MSFLSSVGKCKDCSKEYKYAPEYKSSIFKSKWVKTAGFCGMECYMKQDKDTRDNIVMTGFLKHQLDLITQDKEEMRNKKTNKEYI
tara:strand:+ start:61 stop:318 length:258 start_codon:yes stop_codon:yes gene_type:complete